MVKFKLKRPLLWLFQLFFVPILNIHWGEICFLDISNDQTWIQVSAATALSFPIIFLSSAPPPFISCLPATCCPLPQRAAETFFWRVGKNGMREDGEAEGEICGGFFFSGTSGCFPAVCLARRHAASCPERPRHVLPFNQSGRMNGHWTQSVVSGVEGRGGLGKTQNVQLTLRGMKTPRGRSFSLYVFDLAGFGLLGGVG